MITFFGTSAAAKSDRVGFFEFLNAMNRDAVAARYYEDSEGDVIVEGWYPGEYDRARFGVFMSKFNAVSDQLGDSDIAGRYLGSNSEESDAAAPTTPADETAKTPSGTRSGERKSDQTGRDSEEPANKAQAPPGTLRPTRRQTTCTATPVEASRQPR